MALGKIDHIDLFIDDLGKAEKYFTEKLVLKFVRWGHEGRSADLVSSEGGLGHQG